MMAKMGDSAEYERVKQAAPSEIQAKQNAAHAMLALAAGSSSPILQTPCRHIELLKNLCSKYKLGEPNYEPVGDEGTVRLRVGQHERIVTASSGRLAKELATIQLYTYLHDLYGSSTEIFDKAAPSEIQAKQNAAHAMLALAAGSSSPILQTPCRHIELLKNLCSKYKLGEPNYEPVGDEGTVRLRVGQHERIVTASSGRLAKELATIQLYTYLHDLYGSSTEIFDKAKQNAAHAMLAPAAGSSSPILQTSFRHIELLKNLCSKYNLGEPNYELASEAGTAQLHCFAVRLRVGQYERFATASSGRLAKELASKRLYTYLHDLYGSSTEIFDKAAPSKIQATQNAAHAMLALAAGSSSPILQTPCRHIELLKNLCSKYKLGEPNYELASDAGTAQPHRFAVCLRVGQYERFTTASSARLAKELVSKRLYTYLHDLYGSSTEIFDKAAPSEIQAKQNAAHAMLALAAGSSSPILQTPCTQIELLSNLCSKYKLGEPNYELVSDEGTAQPHRFTVRLRVGQHERVVTASSERLAKELVTIQLYTYLHDLYGSSTEIFDKAAPSEIQAKQNAAHAMLALAAGSSSPILQTPCTQIELLSNLCSKYKLGEPNYELVGDEGTAQPHRFTVRLRVGQHERVVTASSGRLAKELATIQLYTYLHDRYGSSTEIFD